MNNFEIQNLEVGGNFINLRITDNNCHEVELHFWQMDKEIVVKTLAVYGVSLSEKELEEYYGF